MPNEYIMYLSILLVGSLAIAGISVTMIGIDNSMKDRALEANLENILQNISETIHNLMQSGDDQITAGASYLEIEITLTLPQEIHQESYRITASENTNSYELRAILIDDPEFDVRVSLFIDPATITITGTIDSTSFNPSIFFLFDGVNRNIILSD